MQDQFGTYLEDWLARRRTILRPATHHSYRQLILCYLVPQLGHLAMTTLDRRTPSSAATQTS